MKEEQILSEVPNNYPVCLNRNCPKADTCLRQQVEREVDESATVWTIISPKHLAKLKGDCPYYRPNAKASFAKGFMNILENMPHNQRQRAILLLKNQFSERTYYRMRKGERLLSPAEQRIVLNILKKCGIAGTPEFDAYEECYEW